MGFAYDPTVVILKWPEQLRPNQMTVHLQSNTTRFESPFTRSVQTQELPGGRFTVSAGFPFLKDEKTRAMRAFMAKLRGSAGRFYWWAEAKSGAIPDKFAAESVSYKTFTADTTRFTADTTRWTTDATVTPAQTIATATGDSGDPTVLQALTNESPGRVIIQAGRHISFDTPDGWRQLHIVTDDAVAGLGSVVRINVEPPMRQQPAAGAPIHLRSPSGVFMLLDDDQGQISQTPGVWGQVTVEAIEAFPPRIVVTA